MATSNEAGGLAPFVASIGVADSGVGDAVVTGAAPGRDVIGIELTDGTVLTGSESGTTDGTYTITGRSATTASKVMYLIL